MAVLSWICSKPADTTEKDALLATGQTPYTVSHSIGDISYISNMT